MTIRITLMIVILVTGILIWIVIRVIGITIGVIRKLWGDRVIWIVIGVIGIVMRITGIVNRVIGVITVKYMPSTTLFSRENIALLILFFFLYDSRIDE